MVICVTNDIQYTYIHVNSSDIYTLPQYRLKNNSVIVTDKMWRNLISNIAEHQQFYNTPEFFFENILKKFMFDTETDSYGTPYSPGDGTNLYIIDEYVDESTSKRYLMLPGIQPRKPNPLTPTREYGMAQEGDEIGFIATLDYGHNRTRKSKFVFSLFGSYIFYFLFGTTGNSSDNEPPIDAQSFIGSGFGPHIELKTTPREYGIGVLNTFAKQCYEAIEITRQIDPSTEKNTLGITFGFGVSNTGTYEHYIDTVVTDNIMLPEYGNFPTYQMLILHVSTLTHDVYIGNPNGTYYFIPKHTSTSIIIPNPVLTECEFGKTRYYYMFLDSDLSSNNKVLGKIKVWTNDDTDDYILIIHSLETIPDAREVANSYIMARTMQLIDFMFSLLLLLNYMSPMLINYYNIVTTSLGLHHIITKVFWEMLDTTFVDLYEAIHTDSVIQ